MNVIRHASDLAPPDQKVCVAMGVFDGVHLGHQRVLDQTITDAKRHGALAAAVTFDQHPNAVVNPERMPPLIYSLPQRLRVIGSLGIETVLLIHFDRRFSQQSGEAFVTDLARDFGRIQSICVGSSFVFGYKRTGNVALLESLGKRLGFAVHGLAPVTRGEKAVSSTRIRLAIQGGELAMTSHLLGRPYSISGHVLRGDQLGRKLGFPTANLDVAGLALPPDGVYAGQAEVNGATRAAVVNIGRRPTLNRPKLERLVEVHMLDFSGDLYGSEVEFQFGRRLRGEQKFASLDALKEQIGKDVIAARATPG